MQFSKMYSSRLSRVLGTDDTVLFTTARRKGAINEGLSEFANATECLGRRYDISVSAGVSEYDLNSTGVLPSGDFSNFSADGLEYRYTDASSNLTIVARQDVPRVTIDWLNQHEPGWQNSTQASTVVRLPTHHYVRTDGAHYLLGFTPTLGIGSSASAVIRLTYIATSPDLVNDTDEPFSFSTGTRFDLDAYLMGAVHYAASVLEPYRKDWDSSDRQLQKFLSYVARYVQDQRIKGGRAIRQAKNYFQRRGRDESGMRVYPWSGQ